MVVPHTTGQPVRSMVRVPGSGIDQEAMPRCLDLSKVSSLAAAVYVPNTLPKALVRQRQSTTPAETSSKLTNDHQLDLLGSVLKRNGTAHENVRESDSTPSNKRKRTSPSEPLRCNTNSSPSAPPPKRATGNGSPQATQVMLVPATSLAVGKAQLFLIPGSSGVMLQIQQQQSSGTLSIAPLGTQVSTSAVQSPNVLLQQRHGPNSSVKQTCTVQAAVTMNQNVAANIVLTGISSQSPHQTSSIQQLMQERDKLRAENISLQSTLTRYQNLFKNKTSLEKLARYVAEETKA